MIWTHFYNIIIYFYFITYWKSFTCSFVHINQIFIFFKRFTTYTIHSFILTFINIPIIKRFLQYFRYKFMMSFFSCSNKICIIYFKSIPNSLMFSCHHIKIWHDFHSLFFSFIKSFLRIFIYSSRKFYSFPIYFVISSKRIGNYRTISMPNMWNSICIINRCSYKKSIFHFFFN